MCRQNHVSGHKQEDGRQFHVMNMFFQEMQSELRPFLSCYGVLCNKTHSWQAYRKDGIHLLGSPKADPLFLCNPSNGVKWITPIRVSGAAAAEGCWQEVACSREQVSDKHKNSDCIRKLSFETKQNYDNCDLLQVSCSRYHAGESDRTSMNLIASFRAL